MKECTKCKEFKDLSEFHNQTANKDGLKSYCKLCAKEYAKNSHLLHSIYYQILYRCYNVNDKRYKNYGNRGIKVCKE